MRLAWHIFKKDARRLWWAISVTLALFVTVASQEGSLRTFDPRALPHAIEGLRMLLLGNLLPLAWCYVVMLMVQQEPLVGDRQFWVTRPYPWRSLIAAKAMFAVAFVHAPALVIDSTILLSHGFSPLAHAAPLLEKQALIAGLLVLPATALAAVTRTMTHASLGLIALAYLGMTVYNLGRTIDYFFNPTDVVRYTAALVVLTAGCCVVLTLQYRRRRTSLARTAGVLAALITAGLFLYAPRETTFAMSCALRSNLDRGLSVRLDPKGGPPPVSSIWRPEKWSAAAIPITLEDLPDSASSRFIPLEAEIALPGGPRWHAVPSGGGWTADRVVQTDILRIEGKGAWLITRFPDAIREQIAGRRVTLRGKMTVALHRPGTPMAMPVQAESTALPGVGVCSSRVVPDSLGLELIRVYCESPYKISTALPVTLAEGGRSWNQHLGEPVIRPTYTAGSPLSPLYRRHTTFNVSEEVTGSAGSQWRVPPEALSQGRIVITPMHEAGCGIVTFELRDLTLGDYLVSRSVASAR